MFYILNMIKFILQIRIILILKIKIYNKKINNFLDNNTEMYILICNFNNKKKEKTCQ